jgi:type IV pilus assembly protein PilN
VIRINLLPQAKRAARAKTSPGAVGGGGGGSTAPWLIGYGAGLVVWIALLGGVYLVYRGDFVEKQRRNRDLESDIVDAESQTAGLEEAQAKLAESQALEALVNELNRGRSGPTRVLVELSKILSVNGGPTIDPRELERIQRENPHVRINRGWDVKRLWLTSFVEEERQCRIQGTGKTNDDVAEFLRRLALSEIFTNVTLERTQSVEDRDSGLVLISFELSCAVEY